MTKMPNHQDLWAGVDLKIENASFHLDAMARALQPPERTALTAVMESSGALIGGNWHRPFYAHLDAFLSASRSIPEIIRCSFGADSGAKKMRDWFDTLGVDEQDRRRDFEAKYRADYDTFRALPLGTARHISEHRTGFPPVTATVGGRFGVTYVGNPITRIPTSETKELPPEYAWMAKSVPVQPNWEDFDIDGKPLFATCREYIDGAQRLVNRARALAKEVHGNSKVTWPPQEMD
jgi:hypothetical protein